MKCVLTVRGPVSPEELGFCQSHEHLGLRKGQSFLVNPALCIDDVECSAREAERLKAAGGGTVVDAQPVGCGRMTELLRAASLRSGLHIVASTGFHKLIFYPREHWIRRIDEKQLTDIYVHELTEGMYPDSDTELPGTAAFSGGAADSGIPASSEAAAPPPRAGQIKAALDTEGLTPRYKTLFRAAAAAAVKTDAPLMVHIEQDSDPLALLAFLLELGVRPERLIFCHLDRAVPDLAVHRAVAERGVYLEYDTIGRFKYHSDEREAEIFRELVNAGFANRLLFSLDTTRARLRAYDPGAIGLDYLIRSFVPRLLESGISTEDIRLFSHDNFVRAFARKN